MIGLMVWGLASGQYFEPTPMNPDPIDVATEASGKSPGALSSPANRATEARVYDPSALVPANQTRVAVLGYHNFSDSKPVTEMLMRTAEFREQMETIRKLQLRVISMQEFLAWRQGKLQLPARCVLITMDDGWRSVYTDAFPILKEYGYPFTLFLYTKYLSGRGDSGDDSRNAGTRSHHRQSFHESLLPQSLETRRSSGEGLLRGIHGCGDGGFSEKAQ